MNLQQLKKQGKELLKENNLDEREARLLLAFAIGIEPNELIKISECGDDICKKYLDLLEKRISGVPFAYITEHKEFMKLDFIVNKNVLIPRPETELLVDEVLKQNASSLLDMCTGSGCIAISVACYGKIDKIVAADISDEALDIARKNAIKNDAKIEFIKSDLFENIIEKYDIIVSNPPYIKTEIIETLDNDVKCEPYIALDGGEDGLDFYRKIIGNAYKYLNPAGHLMMEIGYDQGEAVKELLIENGYKDVKIIKDLSGNDRICIGEL